MPPSFSERLFVIKKILLTQPRSREDDPVEAVVAILIIDDNPVGLSILLIHRIERDDDPWSGQMGLPGGRVEESDPSTKHALEREVREEVGIDLKNVGEELGLLSIGHPMRRTEMKVQPRVYGLKAKPEVAVGPEVKEAFWVPVSKLLSNSGSAQIQIRGEVRKVPAFLIDGKVVWGFTHRVLSELLEILRVAQH